MKRILVILILIAFSSQGCNLLKPKIKLNDAINEKVKMDQIDNPARKLFIQRNLGKKRIVMENALVKDVTISTNIDYDFCVIVDADTP